MSLDRFEEELRKIAPTDAPSPERRAANRALVMAAVTGLAPPAAGAAASKTALVVKLAIVSTLVIGTVVAVVLATRPPSSPPAPAPSAAVVDLPTVAPPATTSAPPMVTAPPPASAPPAPATVTAPDDPLALEARLLEAARTCSRAGDIACATTKLAAYDKRFPHGALADEATLLHIDVARADGDAPEARRLAHGLLAAHPSGAYAKRARAILTELGE